MYEMTISRPHNYGEGLRNLPMGLSSKSLGHLLGYFKAIRLAHGLPWEKFVRKKLVSIPLNDFPMALRGLGLNSRAGKGKDYHAGFRRSFFRK